jgi:hypothetical protein
VRPPVTSLVERLASLLRAPGDRDRDGDGERRGRRESGGVEGALDAETVRAVAAVVGPVPAGVRTYTVTVRARCGVIADVSPALLARHFQLRDGGPGESHVRVRAVDFAGEARSVAAPTPLFVVRLAGAVPASSLSLSVESMADHGGERVSPDRVRLTVVTPEE